MSTKASTTIPFPLRFLLLYLEPLFALGGVYLAICKPGDYLATMTRGALSAVNMEMEDTRFVYVQLAGGWMHFLFTEAIILRLLDDLATWRLLCIGMLLSDILYLHSTALAVGGWAEYAMLANWTGEDWLVMVTTMPFVLTRGAIVGGVFGGGGKGKGKGE